MFAEKIGRLPVSASNEIVLNCFYDTRNKGTYTFYGNSAEDEMCTTAVAFYPADNQTWFFDLTQTGQVSQCDLSEIIGNCPHYYFSKYVDKRL